MTVRAVWNGTVLAESERTAVVEGNHYFPAEDVDQSHLVESENHTTCPWKGVASYYDVVVDGDRNADAAWYYPEPYQAANDAVPDGDFADRVAFWKGVEITVD
jgi:uncharacterized protein (DUF427 family)